MPAVSFLKAPRYQDAHASNSDPLDEQTFVVNVINAIEKSSFWTSTAIIIAYDDSDGWYDHLSNLVNGSATTVDFVNGPASASAQQQLRLRFLASPPARSTRRAAAATVPVSRSLSSLPGPRRTSSTPPSPTSPPSSASSRTSSSAASVLAAALPTPAPDLS